MKQYEAVKILPVVHFKIAKLEVGLKRRRREQRRAVVVRRAHFTRATRRSRCERHLSHAGVFLSPLDGALLSPSGETHSHPLVSRIRLSAHGFSRVVGRAQCKRFEKRHPFLFFHVRPHRGCVFS